MVGVEVVNVVGLDKNVDLAEVVNFKYDVGTDVTRDKNGVSEVLKKLVHCKFTLVTFDDTFSWLLNVEIDDGTEESLVCILWEKRSPFVVFDVSEEYAVVFVDAGFTIGDRFEKRYEENGTSRVVVLFNW